MPKRKPVLHVAKDLRIASTHEALNESTLAEIQQIRRACHSFLERSEAHIFRRLQKEIQARAPKKARRRAKT